MPTPVNVSVPAPGATDQPAASVAPDPSAPVALTDGSGARLCPGRLSHAAGVLLIAVLSLAGGRASVAAPVNGLRWHFDPERDLQMVRQSRDLDPKKSQACRWSAPNPVVMPQPQWPDQKENNRGWGLIDPAVGLAGSDIANEDESRTAVRLAESGQDDLMSSNAGTVPGQEDLPGPLANIGLKVTMGVEYIF